MKTRNGFVSNSSSASYIVRIHSTSVQDFCNAMAQEFQYDYFDPEKLIERFNDRCKDILKSETLGKHSSLSEYYRTELDQLTILIERLEELKEDSSYGGYHYKQPDAELITDIFNKVYRIQTQYYNGDIILTGNSSMHNSIADVPEILKTICMYYLFEVKKVLECEIDHD